MAGRPALMEGIPSKPSYAPSKNGKKVVAHGLLRLNGTTKPLQGTGRTQSEAFASYQANGELRKTRTVSEVNDHSIDSKLRVVLIEWRRRVTELNRRKRADTSVDTYIAEVFKSTDKRAKKDVIKIEDLADISIRHATTPRLIKYIESILTLGFNAKAQRQRQLLIEIMSIPVEWGILAVNPADAIPEIPDSDAKPRALTPVDLERLREQLQLWVAGKAIPGTPAGRVCDRDQTVPDVFEVSLALTTRPGETFALLWEENDREDGIVGGINLDAVDEDGNPAPYAWVTGKVTQAKGQSIRRVPHTKTGEDGIRRMPIPLYALPLFRRLYQEYLDTPEEDNPLKLVFPSEAGTPRYQNNFRRAWINARGTEFEWVTPGTTRKTGATAVMEELGPEATGEQLGHKGLENVKFYANTPPRVVPAKNAAALDKRLAPAR